MARFFFLMLLCYAALGQQPEPYQTTLQLNSLLQIPSVSSGLTYYAVNLELKHDDSKLFLITVQTDQSDTIQIFTSVYYEGVDKYFQFPNWYNNSNACSYSSIDTCALPLPDVKQGETKNVTVYFSVEIFFTDRMSILTTLEDIYPFKIGIKYDIDFSLWESAVFTLSAADVNQYEQLIVQMQYDSFKDAGRFGLYAGIDEIPNNYNNRIQSKYMGAFTQILILQPLPQNSTYYIVLEGQQGTQFDVVIKPSSISSPKLEMNDTVFYYSSGSDQKDKLDMNFSLTIDYSQEKDILPLLVDLNSLGGYGEFEVDYCDGLTNFTFLNLNGESGEVIIPVEQRKECYNQISEQGSLMIENLIVSIRNVPWYFSFSIGVFEGLFPLMISPYSQKMGTLVSTQNSRIYEMEGYINESFVLKFKTISGDMELNFKLFECKEKMLLGEKCKKLLDSNVDGIVDPSTPEYKQFNYTCVEKRHYKLIVSHGSLQQFDSEYVLLLLPLNQKIYNLSPARPIYSIISKNQYQYYVVNLTLIQKQANITITNSTNILISMVETNGDCMLLTSLVEKYPKYDQIFESESTVDYSWNGKKQYNVNNQTDAIYIGIMGNKQSIYHLQVTIAHNQDTPESYTKLVSDKLLSFTLSSQLKQDHILLSYTAHSIPYTMIISPSPVCIVYSYSLPFENTSCRQLPSEITQKTIYIKVFRKTQQNKSLADEEDYKFIVYVYSGTHYLFEYTPILIACQDTCYEYVTVFVPQKIEIVHKGMGYIGRKDTSEAFSNEKMEITCEKGYPCFLTINASLPFGGQMQLFYDSADIQEIEWMTKPLTFQNIFDPKLFYMQIRSWDSLNTAIFYTEGVSLTIYYNIYSIRENATNALQYEFPNSNFWMRKSIGNPLRRFHAVEFDKKLIQQLGCKDQNDVCIVTLSVYANTISESSIQYVNKTMGYFSCNTYEYYVPMNSPYQLSEEYSLIYFSHRFSEDEKSNMSPFYYVKIQPLSNCRPQIFAPFTPVGDNSTSYDRNMPFYGVYRIDASTLDKKAPEIQFIVSTDTPCEYTLWLMDSEIQPVSENANYEMVSDQNGSVLFVFSDRYLWSDKKFSIKFDQQMNEILIDKYQKHPNGTIKLPTGDTSLNHITQSRQLQYNSAQFYSALYIIKASTSVGNKVNMKISTFQSETVIMTNQIQKFTFSQKYPSMSFQYFSNSDFLMFVTTDWGNVKVTVEDFKRDDDRNVIDVLVNEESDPWIKVKALGGDIRGYIITFENLLLAKEGTRHLQQSDTKYPKVTFHIQQTGTIGLPQLYDGKALFDAFYNDDAQNCYKYVTETIVGRHQITVDLIFGTEFMNALPNIHSRVSMEDRNRINSTWTRIPTGYRLVTEFYAHQVYEFCFSINQQQSLVSKQFYVMVENIDSLKHLTLDVPFSSHQPSPYDIYQYVATENQNVMVEVVNCFGKPTLLGAKQYSDIYLGQVSELGPFYRDETMSVAMKSIELGYFFFGIKLDDLKDRYKIRVQTLQKDEKLHYDKFELKQKTITKVKLVQQNGRQKIRVNLPAVSILKLPQGAKIHHMTYNLLVDNLKQHQQYPSNVIAKCPVLANRNMSSYKFIQTQKQGVKVDIASQQQIRIDIPISEVPENFNLTGYVEISITEPYTQTLTYYYDSTTFKLKNTKLKEGISGIGVVFVIMLILSSLIVIYIIFRRWKKNQNDARVNFQMTNYNYEQNNPNIYEQNNPNIYEQNTPTTYKQRETEPNANLNTSPSRPLKKALNQNVGYGEFIDESM